MKLKTVMLIVLGTILCTQGYGKNKDDENLGKVYCKRAFVRFKTGYNSYDNSRMGNSHFTSVPEEFERYKISTCEYPAEGSLKFEVKEAGMIRILVGQFGDGKFVRQGWKRIGTVKHSNENNQISEHTILEKFMEKGEYDIPHDGKFGIRLLKK